MAPPKKDIRSDVFFYYAGLSEAIIKQSALRHEHADRLAHLESKKSVTPLGKMHAVPDGGDLPACRVRKANAEFLRRFAVGPGKLAKSRRKVLAVYYGGRQPAGLPWRKAGRAPDGRAGPGRGGAEKRRGGPSIPRS